MSKPRHIPGKVQTGGPAHTARASGGVRPQAVVQPKGARVPSPPTLPRRTPVAPPVYRPQPVPRVAQLKPSAFVPPKVARPAPPRPAAFRSQQPTPPAHHVAAQLRPPTPPRPHAPVARPAIVQRATVRATARGVVQAIKLYPNLHPGAVERVEPSSVFRLENFTDQYRLRKTDSHGVYVPNQQYNFVRTGDGATLLHNRYRHPSIAEGRQVLYAGEAFFNNGKLEWWSNGSGHYQPDADDAVQAALPLSNFFTYQQIIKGEHKRKRA